MYGKIGRQKMLAELLSQHNIYGKQVTMNPNHIGTNFEDFLKEEEIIMNDRFKFRIWNGTEMHYNDFVVTATGFVGKITEEFLDKCVFNQEDLTLDKECILMQCTGLKDKNGKLIYEGDVFEATVLNSCDCDENIGKLIRGQVAYFTGNACFTFAAYSPINLAQLEIIGNIHDDQFREITKMVEGDKC